ncbi:MAG: hypothetical protein MZV64_14885, partial [Ignavibacteriales bacterium]|nr:hypothetical protein [Ignavibacteriales bacterium]
MPSASQAKDRGFGGEISHRAAVGTQRVARDAGRTRGQRLRLATVDWQSVELRTGRVRQSCHEGDHAPDHPSTEIVHELFSGHVRAGAAAGRRTHAVRGSRPREHRRTAAARSCTRYISRREELGAESCRCLCIVASNTA